MRHLKKGRKLGRSAAHRKALFNNLCRSLVQYELIQTTDAKAKELRRFADKLITLGKRDSVHARRQAFKILGSRDLVAKVFDDLAKRPELKDRPGGYVRLIKTGFRRGDNTSMTRVSWVGSTIENTESLRYPDYIIDRFNQTEISFQEAPAAAPAVAAAEQE